MRDLPDLRDWPDLSDRIPREESWESGHQCVVCGASRGTEWPPVCGASRGTGGSAVTLADVFTQVHFIDIFITPMQYWSMNIFLRLLK